MPVYSQEASRQQWEALFKNARAWAEQNFHISTEELERLSCIIDQMRAAADREDHAKSCNEYER